MVPWINTVPRTMARCIMAIPVDRSLFVGTDAMITDLLLTIVVFMISMVVAAMKPVDLILAGALIRSEEVKTIGSPAINAPETATTANGRSMKKTDPIVDTRAINRDAILMQEGTTSTTILPRQSVALRQVVAADMRLNQCLSVDGFRRVNSGSPMCIYSSI